MSALAQTVVTPTPLSPAQRLEALLHRAGMTELSDRGWIAITGDDRVRWLNGMVTNSINDLALGGGCSTFLLSAQGRIQGTATIFAEPDRLLLETDAAQIATLLELLDRFIIMDDVELADISGSWTGAAFIGPEAKALLDRIGVECPESAIAIASASRQGTQLRVIAARSPLIPRYEVWSDSVTIETLRHMAEQAGAAPCDAEALEHLRLLEGTPRFGVDIRDRELPQETNQSDALHFNKGCYLGQEIVERIRSRGAVHRTFSGFRITGSLPALGSLIEADGRSVGELTSVARVPLASGAISLGLGYVRREALERNAILRSREAEVSPISLPFRIQ